MFLLYNDKYKIIGVSSEPQENSLEFSGNIKIPYGSVYDKNNNFIITPQGLKINLNIEQKDIVLEEI